jgi:hypothetical protein
MNSYLPPYANDAFQHFFLFSHVYPLFLSSMFFGTLHAHPKSRLSRLIFFLQAQNSVMQTPADPLLSSFLTRISFPPFSQYFYPPCPQAPLPLLTEKYSAIPLYLPSLNQTASLLFMLLKLSPKEITKDEVPTNPEANVSKTAVSNIVPNHNFCPRLQEDTSQMSTLMAVWGALGLAGAFAAVVPPLCAATSMCQTLVNEALEPWHAAGIPQGSPLSNFVLALGLLGGVPLASAAGEGYPSYFQLSSHQFSAFQCTFLDVSFRSCIQVRHKSKKSALPSTSCSFLSSIHEDR